LLGVTIACSSHPSPTPSRATLGDDLVARVGAVEIPRDLVAQVARARGLAPRAALDRIVEDALFADGARAAGLDDAVSWQLVAARAEYVADRVRDEAAAAGPITQAESDPLLVVRVIHVVVLRPKDASDVPRARTLAEDVARAVADARTPDDFEARAQAVAHEGPGLQVERLPPFARDGRVTDPGTNAVMDATFTAAAFGLNAPGATSEVVETTFGWHVIRLIDRTLPSDAYNRVLASRARRLHDALVASAATRAPVSISPAADALMAEALGAPQ
jgi:peptidyl-prolyl cis-trans isomerase C